MISYSFLEAQNNIFQSNGNVGIGTTTPQQALDVVGSVRISTGQIFRPDNAGIGFSVSNGINTSYGNMNFNNAYGNITNMVITDAGNVGIGTGTTPSAKLQINGVGANLQITNSGNGSGLFEIGMAYCNGCYAPSTAIPGDAVMRTLGGGNLILSVPSTNENRTRAIKFCDDDATIMQVWNGGKIQMGNVSVASNEFRLFVDKGILTERVKITLKNNASEWPDYVFDKHYKLPSLAEVEQFLDKNKHLPDIPSAKEVKSEGIDVAEMDAKLLKKIEELTLYMIELNKKMEKIEKENVELKQEIKSVNRQTIKN